MVSCRKNLVLTAKSKTYVVGLHLVQSLACLSIVHGLDDQRFAIFTQYDIKSYYDHLPVLRNTVERHDSKLCSISRRAGHSNIFGGKPCKRSLPSILMRPISENPALKRKDVSQFSWLALAYGFSIVHLHSFSGSRIVTQNA